MKFECPSCQMQLQAEPEFAGKYVRCPGCNTKLQIPETVSSQSGLQGGIPKPKLNIPAPSIALSAPDAGEEAPEEVSAPAYDREQFERGGWEEKDPTNPNGYACFGIGVAATIFFRHPLSLQPGARDRAQSYSFMQYMGRCSTST